MEDVHSPLYEAISSFLGDYTDFLAEYAWWIDLAIALLLAGSLCLRRIGCKKYNENPGHFTWLAFFMPAYYICNQEKLGIPHHKFSAALWGISIVLFPFWLFGMAYGFNSDVDTLGSFVAWAIFDTMLIWIFTDLLYAFELKLKWHNIAKDDAEDGVQSNPEIHHIPYFMGDNLPISEIERTGWQKIGIRIMQIVIGIFAAYGSWIVAYELNSNVSGTNLGDVITNILTFNQSTESIIVITLWQSALIIALDVAILAFLRYCFPQLSRRTCMIVRWILLGFIFGACCQGLSSYLTMGFVLVEFFFVVNFVFWLSFRVAHHWFDEQRCPNCRSINAQQLLHEEDGPEYTIKSTDSTSSTETEEGYYNAKKTTTTKHYLTTRFMKPHYMMWKCPDCGLHHQTRLDYEVGRKVKHTGTEVETEEVSVV